MAKITYTDTDGSTRTVDVDNGVSVMEGAIRNDFDGILAECGGCCSCATCHIYVDDAWIERVGTAGEIEKEMLEITENVQANSRLSCQITVSDEIDGLHVIIAQQG